MLEKFEGGENYGGQNTPNKTGVDPLVEYGKWAETVGNSEMYANIPATEISERESRAGRKMNAQHEEREENTIGNGEGVRKGRGDESILRVDKQGENQRNGNENRTTKESKIETFVIEAKSKEELEKKVKTLTRKRIVISRVDRQTWESIVVVE